MTELQFITSWPGGLILAGLVAVGIWFIVMAGEGSGDKEDDEWKY